MFASTTEFSTANNDFAVTKMREGMQKSKKVFKTDKVLDSRFIKIFQKGGKNE